MIVKVKLESSYNLESLGTLLSKYRDFKSIYREIKINSLLNKKSLLEIDEINPPILCGFKSESDNSGFWVQDIKNSSFVIKSMNIILDSNLEIFEISLEISILETPSGSNLNKIIELVEFRPLVSLLSEYQKESIWEILGFYAKLID
jgi:hypothetical protein